VNVAKTFEENLLRIEGPGEGLAVTARVVGATFFLFMSRRRYTMKASRLSMNIDAPTTGKIT
jgi:hypothetical protein